MAAMLNTSAGYCGHLFAFEGISEASHMYFTGVSLLVNNLQCPLSVSLKTQLSTLSDCIMTLLACCRGYLEGPFTFGQLSATQKCYQGPTDH
jgi:hypothetical protein